MAEPSSPAGVDTPVAELFTGLLAATHLTRPNELAGVLAEQARTVGVQELVLYLIDYEQVHLVPVPSKDAASRAVLSVEGTIAGRAFVSSTVLHVEADEPDRRRLWMPLLDGTERLGVVELVVPAAGEEVAEGMVEVCERYTHLAAQMVIGKGAYGDVFELVRRRQPMSVSAELQWKLLPPLTFATNGLVVAGVLEPCYSAGGDSFDYAVNNEVAHLAVFDAMGHGLAAAGAASLALAAYRNARRSLHGLAGTYERIDAALVDHYAGERYVTAVLAELDLDTGFLRWVNAGHPPPLLLRRGRLVKVLEAPPSTPLGVPLGEGPVVLGQESLEPGDRVLFYTDGLTEARTPAGEFFSVERLGEFVERQTAAGMPAPETLRRLRQAILSYQDGQLQDDASALLVEWRRETELALLPSPSPVQPSH